MAKFTKLNIGDAVASSGGRRFRKLLTELPVLEQLPSPYLVTIDGDTLTWGDYSALATNFDILVDGVVSANTAEQSFPLSYFGFSDGTYSISVVSKADGYLDSDPSEAVEYVVGGGSLGTFTYAQTTAWYSTPIIRQFRLGMTWAEFIASEYNAVAQDGEGNYAVVGQFEIGSSNNVIFKGANLSGNNALSLPVYYNYSTTKVKADSVIDNNSVYKSSMSGGGAN